MNLTEQLSSILTDLQGVWTESILMLGAILLLLVGLVRKQAGLIRGVYGGVILVAVYVQYTRPFTGTFLSDSLTMPEGATAFVLLFLVTGGLLLLFQRTEAHATECYFFLLSLLAGCLFMAKANSLLMVYLAIELVSFTSYLLTNFPFNKKALEAGIKYLLFGAISSAIMLFGIGLIYGTTGTFFISEWSLNTFDSLLSQAGVLFLLIGLFFKLSIVPAHVWVPGTYQSAPADVVALISVVPKLAALLLLQRMVGTDAMVASSWLIPFVLMMGILTVVVGTLGAFQQQHARRMISFGAIAHSGFLLPFAILSSTPQNEAFWYYAVIYALMNVAVFYLLDLHERKGVVMLSDYKGLQGTAWMGVSFALMLVSLTGLPPLAGFNAKLFLFTSLFEKYQSANEGMFLSYLIVTVLATVGSLFFYLKVPKNQFLAEDPDAMSINFKFSTKILATLFCIVLLLLFFVPKLVMEVQHFLNVHE